MEEQFTVLFINNDGGGFARAVSVLRGTRLCDFLEEQGVTEPERFQIRVGNEIVPEDYLLTSGCKVTASPVKMVGA